MLSAKELRKILAEPETDRAYFAKFSEVMRSKWPDMSEEELKNKWRELKTDAGLSDA